MMLKLAVKLSWIVRIYMPDRIRQHIERAVYYRVVRRAFDKSLPPLTTLHLFGLRRLPPHR